MFLFSRPHPPVVGREGSGKQEHVCQLEHPHDDVRGREGIRGLTFTGRASASRRFLHLPCSTQEAGFGTGNGAGNRPAPRLKAGSFYTCKVWRGRDLLAAVMARVSGFERQRLIERVHAGLNRARRQGRAPGRPRTFIVLLRTAADLAEAGTPVAAARAKGVSRACCTATRPKAVPAPPAKAPAVAP